MFKKMIFGFLLSTSFYLSLSAAESTELEKAVRIEREEAARTQNIPFCLDQIHKAKTSDEINNYEERLFTLIQNGKTPTYEALRFIYWQINDIEILFFGLTEIQREKKESFVRICARFKEAGHEYIPKKEDEDNCSIS